MSGRPVRRQCGIPELRWKFFIRGQQEDESLTQFMVALQNLWKHLEKKDVHSCITTLDKLLRDQFVVGMKAGPVKRALQERVKAQCTFSFNNIVVDAVAQEQEDAEATMAVTKWLHLKDEASAPSPVGLTDGHMGAHPGCGFLEARDVHIQI